MNEALNQEIARLEEQEADLQSKLAGMDKIEPEYRRIEDELNATRNRLGEKRNELATHQQLEQNHEVRMQETTEQIAYILDGLSYDDLRMRDMCVGEKEYQLLRILVQQAFTEQADKLSRQISGAEEREIQLRRQNDDLQDKIESVEAQLGEVSSKAAKFEFERDKALEARDNAANALEEARAEIDRLNSQVDDLRKELAVGARNAYRVIDTEAQKQQVAELVKQIKESKIKVINMRPVDGDLSRKMWQAEDAATGQQYTFNYLEKGKYLELSPEEGLQFRLEYQAKLPVPDQPLDEVAPPAIPDVTDDQFRDGSHDVEQPAEGSSDGQGTGTEPVGSGNDAAVSRTEFQALEARVAQLERRGMVA